MSHVNYQLWQSKTLDTLGEPLWLVSARHGRPRLWPLQCPCSQHHPMQSITLVHCLLSFRWAGHQVVLQDDGHPETLVCLWQWLSRTHSSSLWGLLSALTLPLLSWQSQGLLCYSFPGERFSSPFAFPRQALRHKFISAWGSSILSLSL